MAKLKKPVKIIIIVLAVLVVLLIVAALILPKQMAMAVYNENFGVRFTTYEPLAWNIEDFDGLMRDKYTFESDKGQMLTGYKYYRDNTEEKGLVVLAHGFGGGGHCSYMSVADYFASNGYAVFAYDATGNDESEGEAVGGLPQGVIDLDYALRFVKSSEDFAGLPIMLWGHSWGGYSVGSAMKLHPDVKAAVIVAGFNESLDMLEFEGRNIAGDAIDFVLPYFEEYEKETFGDYASMSVLDGLGSAEADVMILHSTDDDMIPIEKSYDRYYEKFSGNDRFTFIRYEDRGHNYIFCSPEAMEYRIEYNAAADAWLESIGGSENLTEEMRADYYKENFDRHKGYELDSELMAQMLELYNNSLN
ncbi:MAG: alpha/beta fold hydrolase [Oscillospiraceae bacterium]|nr:alpha/beta fold hydrolase [Oscillospiraceae bacterium]